MWDTQPTIKSIGLNPQITLLASASNIENAIIQNNMMYLDHFVTTVNVKILPDELITNTHKCFIFSMTLYAQVRSVLVILKWHLQYQELKIALRLHATPSMET